MKSQKKNKPSIQVRIVDAFLTHARQGQSDRSGLRTNFNLALCSFIAIFIYFLLVFLYIYMNDISSSGNTGLFFVLVGGFVAALLGAFYSSKLVLIFKMMSPAGRREKFINDQKKLKRRIKQR